MMWTRQLLKENAKVAFKRNYWTCVLASVILMLIGGGVSGPDYNFDFKFKDSVQEYSQWNPFSFGNLFMLSAAFLIGLIVLALVIVISALITNVIEVGGKRYFLENREHKTYVSQVLYGFSCGSYLNCVKTMFLRNLYIFGWSLLLIIPGIVKGYAYAMVPYIMAENPSMNSDRAIGLSEEMMKGHKMELFVLQLSFIGWHFLNACTFGIVGIFYANPYIHATYAEYFSAVKAEAIGKGITNGIELPGVSGVEFQQTDFAGTTFQQEDIQQDHFQQTGYEQDDIFAE